MFTNKDLAPYERPARIYCGRVQQNPDEMVQSNAHAVIAVANLRPRWMNVAENMVHLSLMMVSMREAIGPQAVVQ